MPKNFDQILKRVRRVFILLLTVSLLALTWLASFHLAATGMTALPEEVSGPADLAAILFGAAQVNLFILSILLGVFGIFGWRAVEGRIREAVKVATTKRLEGLENEARGRSFAILGYLIGESSVTPDFLKPMNEERLREAISYCERAYDLLKNTGLPAEFMTLNNLLGYSCVLRDRSRRGYLLDGARRLRAAAEEHDSPNLLLTYSRTFLEFGLDPKEIEEACSIVADIQSNSRLNEKQRREAEYLASLCKQSTSGAACQPPS